MNHPRNRWFCWSLYIRARLGRCAETGMARTARCLSGQMQRVDSAVFPSSSSTRSFQVRLCDAWNSLAFSLVCASGSFMRRAAGVCLLLRILGELL